MIEAFRAVVLTGSVSGGAEMMNVSQPAVSRLIKSLETEIGLKLFERRRGRIFANDDALTLLDEVRRSYVGLDRIGQTAALLRKGETGEFRIASMPVVGLSVLPEAISKMQTNYPDLNVSLRVVRSPTAIQYLTSQQCDIAFVESAYSDTSLLDGPSFELESVCVFQKNHPLHKKSVITPEDLAGQPFVSLDSDSRTRIKIDAIFDGSGIGRVMRTEAPLSNAVCALVLQGCGVSIVDPMSARMFEPLGLASRPFRPTVSFAFNTVMSTRSAASATCQTFVKTVEEQIASIESK